MSSNNQSLSVPLSLRKKRFKNHKTTLALAIPGMLLSVGALAEEADVIELDTLQIEERTLDTNPYSEKGAPYKAKISGDARRVKPLAETPQTISVLTQTQLEESGDTDLRDILAAQPGISLGTGENGNAFGDRYVIRGHEARSDVFIDGLRDPGMTTRESFAVEQIEISKGSSATFAGRGTTGGAVNSITKHASTEYDFTKVNVGLGTDSFQRLTLDSNQKINSDLALRANILYSEKDVPDRAPANEERKGLALSAAWDVSSTFKLLGDYYYLEANDAPDLGSYIDRDTGKANENIPVYLQDEDFLDSDVEIFTLRAEFDLSDGIQLTNAMRYGTTENGYVVTGVGKSTRDASDLVAPGVETLSGSTHTGWQELDYFANLTTLFIDTSLGNVDHQFVFTAEYTKQDVQNGRYNIESQQNNCIVGGRRGANPTVCFTDENDDLYSGIQSLFDRDLTRGDATSDQSVETISVGIMDTIDVTDNLTVFAGIRADSFDYENDVDGSGLWAYDDVLWNGQLGLVYDVSENGNVYLNYSTASNINGGETDVGINCGYGGLCGDITIVDQSEPEDTENIELGTKWNILDEKLLATAAVFQTTKSNVMESQNGFDYSTNGFLNSGENRVRGIELGLSGNITDKFSASVGASVMDSEITDSYTEENIGGILGNFADDSAFAQLRYQVTDAFSAGAVASYSSGIFVGQPDSAANENLGTPSYSVYDVFATYKANDQLSVRLNIGNVTDKTYYLAAYRSGTFAYLGEARNAQLTVSYEF